MKRTRNKHSKKGRKCVRRNDPKRRKEKRVNEAHTHTHTHTHTYTHTHIHIYIYIYICASHTLPSFLTVLVSSSFHFYLCPFLVIFLSAPLIDSFFFFHLLFSPVIFFQSCFRHFLRSIFPIYAVILNVVTRLIFPNFFFLPCLLLSLKTIRSRIVSNTKQLGTIRGLNCPMFISFSVSSGQQSTALGS